METELLIALQAVISIARAIAQSGEPTPEQLAQIELAELTAKKKLDLDLAVVAAGGKPA